MRNVVCRNRDCRWMGERLGGNANLGPLPFAEFYRQLAKRVIAKPCPRCGGKVRLIRDLATGKWLP